MAPILATSFQVICPDLRGYGRSAKPASDATHTAYSKKSMAQDIVKLMQLLGHEKFYVGAHDRGARVAHRLGMDFPDHVLAMSLLDIAPTREMYQNTNDKFATAYWHWFFLIQPYPIPEQIIGADPIKYWTLKCTNQARGEHPFDKVALEEYLDTFNNSETIHATCEDYRAAATIDIEHDNQDGDRKLDMPVQILWAKQGVIESCFDALSLWRQRAAKVHGECLDATHYMAEEIPEQIASMMSVFFSRPHDY